MTFGLRNNACSICCCHPLSNMNGCRCGSFFTMQSLRRTDNSMPGIIQSAPHYCKRVRFHSMWKLSEQSQHTPAALRIRSCRTTQKKTLPFGKRSQARGLVISRQNCSATSWSLVVESEAEPPDWVWIMQVPPPPLEITPFCYVLLLLLMMLCTWCICKAFRYIMIFLLVILDIMTVDMSLFSYVILYNFCPDLEAAWLWARFSSLGQIFMRPLQRAVLFQLSSADIYHHYIETDNTHVRDLRFGSFFCHPLRSASTIEMEYTSPLDLGLCSRWFCWTCRIANGRGVKPLVRQWNCHPFFNVFRSVQHGLCISLQFDRLSIVAARRFLYDYRLWSNVDVPAETRQMLSRRT